MPEEQPTTRTDPELVRQLDRAADVNDNVEAVFIFHPDDASDAAPSAERTEELTEQVLRRIRRRTGESEERVNVFKQLGSFVVCASPAFIRQIISEPEIAAAVANRQPGATIEKQVTRSPRESKTKKKQI
ncbi:MAG TPA: hypothetical protein VFV34_29070 [Blastocatellia bacterium]|nr:hypothetical protein [Blastocatellia bacterium]